MDILNRIERVETNFNLAKIKLFSFIQSQQRMERGLLGAGDEEKRAVVQKLKDLSHSRSESIYAEVDLLETASRHLLTRTSYNLRYRSLIWGDRVRNVAGQIDADLKGVANNGALAEVFTMAAKSFDPVNDDERCSDVRLRIAAYLSEASRMIGGIMRSPLTSVEAQDFHSAYPHPDDPRAVYGDATEKLAENCIDIAELATDRITQSCEYAEFILGTVSSVFAEHAAGMQKQVVDMLMEAANSTIRIGSLIQSSRDYHTQALACR